MPCVTCAMGALFISFFQLCASYLSLFLLEYTEKRQLNRTHAQDEKTRILTDTLLGIERDGEFPDNGPCPYLGVRKPIRDGKYPNEYDGITCKPHRPNEKDCELAYEKYGSASELSPEECEEIKYKDLCKFQANTRAEHHSLECDWSTCFPRKPYIGEMSSIYGKVARWIYAPSDSKIEEIIHRTMKNGFNFVFFKCGSLRQVLSLPRTIKISSKRSKGKKINVNLILIDSISRPHFYRSMPQTIDALRQVVYNESIPATVLDYELLQSVSQHTMDNCRPLYSGVTSGKYTIYPVSSSYIHVDQALSQMLLFQD